VINQLPIRQSIRLQGFDYSQAGAYFVTICSYDRKCIFGNITNCHLQLTEIGSLVIACWKGLAHQYPFISHDTWVLMPNHLHGILWLNNDYSKVKSLGKVVAAFKAMSTSQTRQFVDHKMKLWQRDFFEHIIRDQNDLFRLRQYISDNPTQWTIDVENPDR
jgi:putative transposase